MRVKIAGGVSRYDDEAINERCSFVQQQRSQAQHGAKLHAVKKERYKTTKTAALAAEVTPEGTSNEAADIEADKTQVASRVARATPPSPAVVPLDDGINTSGSSSRASNFRKEDMPSGALQSTPVPDSVASVAEDSAAIKSTASTTGGPAGITKSNATAPSARGRRNTQRRTRDVVHESRNRKAAQQGDAQLEARRRCRSKPEVGEQADEAYHNVVVKDKNLRDGKAVGSSTTTPAEAIPTGWPQPIEGASWTQTNTEPKGSAIFSPRNGRECRPGVNTDANPESVDFWEGCKRVRSSNAEELPYSARDVRRQPRLRNPRSSPLKIVPQRSDTSLGAKASQSRPIPLPLSLQVQARKVHLMTDTSTCSGWGSVSPSATRGNENGWPLVDNEVSYEPATSAPKSRQPPASPRGVIRSVPS